MISSRSLLIKLGKRFPRHLALKNRDPYVGHQVGQMPLTISKILLCLDFDLTVLEQVKIHRPDLVITHHPFIYGLKAKVFANDPVKALIAQQMEEMGIIGPREGSKPRKVLITYQQWLERSATKPPEETTENG